MGETLSSGAKAAGIGSHMSLVTVSCEQIPQEKRRMSAHMQVWSGS